MRLLFVHADHLAFEATTRAGAEELAEAEGGPTAGRLADCLAVFVGVEAADEADLDAVTANAAAELRDVAGELNTHKAVLYPAAHLSEDPADSEATGTVLQNLEASLGEFEMLRAPVGWYKALDIAAKGHPHAVRVRRVDPRRDRTEARAPSEWAVLTPDGERLDPVAARGDLGDGMAALLAAEVEGAAASRDETPSGLELARELSLAEFEGLGDGSDARWYPRGKLVRDALTEFVTNRVVEFGAMPVETPTGGSDPFSVVRDARSDFPLRLYEERDRAMYTATEGMDGACEEFERQARLALEVAEAVGLSSEVVLRTTRAFHDEHREWVASLVASLGRPVLLELLPGRREGRSARLDLVAVGGSGRPIETGTVRIDAGTAERFDVADGEDERRPVVLRCSPTGTMERTVAALLGQAAVRKTPRLPTWLSPTQVRFVPVDDEHLAFCDELVDNLEAAGVRADIDEREETVGRRIARAETDWVPYYVVVGDRELDGSPLGVTVRETGREAEMDPDELRETVLSEVGDLPKRPRYLPRHVSSHPDFTGRT